MKKILLLIIIGTLILSGFGAGALNNLNENTKINDKITTTERATHTVLGEYGTASWCHYCIYAHGALKELYAEGQLDFNYVSLVTEKGTPADARCLNDYNAYGWPTLWWDGGYRVDVGASSVAQAKSAYTNSINVCGTRTVKDVNIDLTIAWLGGTNMQIDCTVNNNEGSTYSGTIRVYIIEKVSSRGWYDNSGQLYTHPFLDWAFNQAVSIGSDDSWSDSMTWDGTSHGFPTVTSNNIMVVAAIFNSESHQGYSNPPSGNPFTAYYVDDVVTAEPITNHPPNKPTITGGSSGDPGTNYALTLTTTDYEQEDVYYWVEWGNNSNSGWVGPFASGATATINHIYANVGIYEIKAKAKDINDLESDWSDPHQIIIGNLVPSNPTISGPTSGKIKTEIEFTFVATDPNEDKLYYTIKWGDGSSEDWIGPYNSGEEVKMSHSWKKEGTWYVEAKVKDTGGLESGWTRLVISTPRTKESFNLLFTHVFDRFPILFKLLENLLNY